MASIVLENVEKTYPDGFQAVKGVSLTIPAGSLCVLVGPSGCGKSSTLRMVAGLEDISGGTISIDGRVVNEVHPKDRDIAMVFQSYALYPHMSVYDNMAFALKMRRLPKAEVKRRVHAAAETLGLTPMLNRKPAALSGGQRQRVAVGRAIVREPKAFLFDEPLSNLDAKLRVTTRAEIKALQLRLKTTTIYVTHDQEEAMSLGDLLVVMSNGLVQQSGSPMELYRRPANRFVGTFIGTPPMNILEGELRKDGNGVAFVEGSSDHSGRAYTLTLSDRLAAKVSSHVGRPVALGVRPPAMRVVAAGHAAAWPMRAAVAELMGDHTDVVFGTPKHPRIVARLPAGEETRAGTVLSVAIDPDAVHVFEPGEFGRNLTL